MDEYRDRDLTSGLTDELNKIIQHPMRIMEVCGTHTTSIFRHGLRTLLPPKLELISGPGCPVCVTPTGHIDAFVEIGQQSDVTIATFGDLLRVPGSTASLMDIRGEGAHIELVYSPMDALQLAQASPDRMVVFLAVGFETTTPGIAAAVLEAERLALENFTIFAANKVMPPPLASLMGSQDLNIDGLLCPGHVSVIIGSEAYDFLVKDYGLSCVVAGFEATDIMQGLIMLARQINQRSPRVENAYSRAVTRKGNQRAKDLVAKVFEATDTEWRGLGTIPLSGLSLREKYRKFDVLDRLNIKPNIVGEPKGCRCGEILSGRSLPPACPLFKKRCTPLNPVGPCMVSSEGTCAAFFRYGYNEQEI